MLNLQKNEINNGCFCKTSIMHEFLHGKTITNLVQFIGVKNWQFNVICIVKLLVFITCIKFTIEINILKFNGKILNRAMRFSSKSTPIRNWRFPSPLMIIPVSCIMVHIIFRKMANQPLCRKWVMKLNFIFYKILCQFTLYKDSKYFNMIGQHENLSDKDIWNLNAMYECNEPNAWIKKHGKSFFTRKT